MNILSISLVYLVFVRRHEFIKQPAYSMCLDLMVNKKDFFLCSFSYKNLTEL